MEIKDSWDFVGQYYPKYSSSNEIAENDTLHKICDGELDGDAETCYNEKKNELRYFYGGTLGEEELEAEVNKYFENLKNESDAAVFDSAIEGYIETITNPEKTYYLLGEDATNEYNENGIEGVVSEYEDNNLSYSSFCFIEGITRSSELADAMNGWNDYAIITEEEFKKL
jgi:hypothetical protein